MVVKKRKWWLILYGLLITVAFLYLLFPADVVKSRLEARLSSPHFSFKAEFLQPSLPFGIRLKSVALNVVEDKDVLFQGESFDFQTNLFSLWQKNSVVRITGKAYGGNFQGRIIFPAQNDIYPPVEGTLNFQNIDLERHAFIKKKLGKQISGKMRGSLFYQNASASSQQPVFSITLFLSQGNYTLPESFLGLNKIVFDSGEIKAQWNKDRLQIKKMEIFGPQFNCSLKGNIIPAVDVKNSQLNLTGVIETAGKNKIRTNITINGTLAHPVRHFT